MAIDHSDNYIGVFGEGHNKSSEALHRVMILDKMDKVINSFYEQVSLPETVLLGK